MFFFRLVLYSYILACSWLKTLQFHRTCHKHLQKEEVSAARAASEWCFLEQVGENAWLSALVGEQDKELVKLMKQYRASIRNVATYFILFLRIGRSAGRVFWKRYKQSRIWLYRLWAYRQAVSPGYSLWKVWALNTRTVPRESLKPPTAFSSGKPSVASTACTGIPKSDKLWKGQVVLRGCAPQYSLSTLWTLPRKKIQDSPCCFSTVCPRAGIWRRIQLNRITLNKVLVLVHWKILLGKAYIWGIQKDGKETCWGGLN